MTQFTVMWREGYREFRSWKGAETWARQQVATLDERGCAWRADIYDDSDGVCVATVRMDGTGRVWTDIMSAELAV